MVATLPRERSGDRSEEIMPNDIDDDAPISHAIADRWADFAELCIGSADRAQAHITVHFGAMCVLRSAQPVIAAFGRHDRAHGDPATIGYTPLPTPNDGTLP
jgi:hypothetical protein